MVTPYQKSKQRNRDGAVSDHSVAEDPFVAVNTHELADDTHRWQNHDVNGGVGIEPEKVLERNRIPVEFRIENPDSKQPLGREQQNSDPENWSRENLDNRCRIERPQKERHAEPGHPGWTHRVDRHDEIQARKDRAKPEHKHPKGCSQDRTALLGVDAVGCVEGPTCVESRDR